MGIYRRNTKTIVGDFERFLGYKLFADKETVGKLADGSLNRKNEIGTAKQAVRQVPQKQEIQENPALPVCYQTVAKCRFLSFPFFPFLSLFPPLTPLLLFLFLFSPFLFPNHLLFLTVYILVLLRGYSLGVDYSLKKESIKKEI